MSQRLSMPVKNSQEILTPLSFLLKVIFPIIVISQTYVAESSPLKYRVDYRRGYLVNVGETINLICPYTAPFYKWTPATQTSWILSEDQTYSLKAESLAVSGKYICSAVNGFGHNEAEFSIKVIDKFSPALEQSCALLSNGRVSDSGPCFLNTYTEPELTQLKPWGEDVNLDCESVAVEELADRITYTWTFQPLNPVDPALSQLDASEAAAAAAFPPFYASEQETRPPRMTGGKDVMISGVSGGGVGVVSGGVGGSPELKPTELVARFSGSTFRIRRITLAHAGEYRCSVAVDGEIGEPPGALTLGKLSRTFRIRVQPRSEGEIIQGPHNVTATVELGRDASFSCEINEGEHRSATIRWGKYISLEESGSTDFRTSEVLHWSGGTYVVLPTILPQDLQQFFDIPKPLAVNSPGSRRSRLVLRSTSPRDAGLYICSVITESGRDDHKFVHISLKDGDTLIESMGGIGKTSQRHLTIYIVVPICVFLICILAVASLIIRNRSHANRQRSQRNGQKPFFISQGIGSVGEKPSLNSSHRFLDHSSMAGSNSMTFTRSGSPQRQGRSTASSKAPPTGASAHMQLRPSPMNSTTNTSTSQLQPNQFSPGHAQPSSYIYPSPATDCAYLSADAVPMRQPYASPPISTYSPSSYTNGHVDFQRYPQVKGAPYAGYPRSGDPSADIFHDQSSNPFVTGIGSAPPPPPCEQPGNAQEAQNRRFFCVNPVNGSDTVNHLQS